MSNLLYYLKLFVKCKTKNENTYYFTTSFEMKNVVLESELEALKHFMCLSVEKETHEKVISSEFISKEEYDDFQMEENEFDVVVEE